MIGAIRSVLRAGFSLIERPFERLFSPQLNPLAQLGALGFFFFWIVAVSGIYLFIFFDTGIERAYQSVEHLTQDYWFHAGVMRSFHRYASDLMVVMVVVHLLREFSLDHYRGVRWFSWITGLPIIWLLYASGITGYWLVWDKLAQYVAIVSSELLDWLPIFGEPIARNFISTGTLTSRFFSLMVFMHVAVPLFLLFIMWIHILRISRPKMNPPRTLALLSLTALLAVSIWKPALSQGHADLAKVPAEVGLDWLYLPLYPLTNIWGNGAVWAFLGAFSLMIALMPWLPPLRRAKPAQIDLEHCNGCARCAEDCPYEAIRMVRRTDDMPFPTQAEVNPSLCVSCGICVGACPSSTPFRRSEDLKTGIDLPDYSLKELRERVVAAAAYADQAGARAGARLRTWRRRGTPRWNGRHALCRDDAAVADRLRPQPRPRRRRGGRGLRGERLLQPPRYQVDGAALCRAARSLFARAGSARPDCHDLGLRARGDQGPIRHCVIRCHHCPSAAAASAVAAGDQHCVPARQES